jgi:hypothetical protein
LNDGKQEEKERLSKENKMSMKKQIVSDLYKNNNEFKNEEDGNGCMRGCEGKCNLF